MRYTLATLAVLAATALAAPTATAFPSAASNSAIPTARVISGVFDGKMVRFSRNPDVCKGQKETGEEDAMFIAEDGATIKNVIISKAQAEGIHCRGACTLQNVWWEDVCEDAATFKQPAGKTSYVIGGGAKGASDKIFQFNGRGTVSIKDFFADTYGKIIRSCGDCKGNGGPRNIIIDGVTATNGGVLCGINSNYGDTCKISNSCQNKNKNCDRYTGVEKGNGESKKLGSGPDGKSCTVTGFTSAC
ncbi:polysaccharide lyase family 3 protein [Cucurbitaria berberidis CBS 394.84]|uniref:Pectate lyase n=1 Tax=Cucurbitaria berberidis CBS 394.84 TaxID=1168544 RepID=A0A9P4GRP0_9PLEO|nr:polysaccharide lyase family 3 protein [Cucurbitaria berberidis CBS 394.84]KAF1850156.1 polysaccharide lyase family 3 protein [Cucurbitaria berberidis CBS 394.84]